MTLSSDPMIPVPWVIRRVRRETPDTFTLDLSPPGGRDHFAFEPGQFNMLYAFGVGEAPISISGDPASPEPLLHTIRVVGSVTRALCHLKKGEMAGVRGPFGTSWPVAAAAGNDVVIIAGGLGLAPLRPALYYLLSHREAYGKIELIYGARTPRTCFIDGNWKAGAAASMSGCMSRWIPRTGTGEAMWGW